MGLFRPYERSDAEPAKAAEPAATAAPKPVGKAAPTPSRRDAEAARRERLNPTLTPKEAKARERAARASLREEQFAKVENVPGRVLMRDFVDSHRGIAQWSMPLLMITLALSLGLTAFAPDLAISVTMFTYLMFLLIAADIFVMWRRFKKLAAERLPGQSLKGLLGYMINRSINLRRLRMPSPRVKPGDPI